jgi:periplasmic divalent cation tolerance protein
VQVTGPAATVVRWESVLEEAQEWQLRITTAARLLPTLERHISEKQRQDVVDFTVTAIIDGSADYLRWITKQLV